MADHARAVIIGGGVGGTSIAYHLAERGWTDIVLVDRAELTSGSTFHSAGLVGQLRSSVTLTRMMMYGADLYRRLAAETGTDPAWHEVGSLRLASTPERFEELRRQAGWAKTFGLPLELIGRGRGAGALPVDVDRRGPRRGLPPDRRLARSVGSGPCAGRRGAGARRPDPDPHPGGRRSAPATAGSPGSTVEHGGERTEILAEVVVNAGGIFAPEIGRMAGDRPSRSSRWRTSTCSPSRSTACTAGCPSCATRTTWSTSARRSAGCAWAATSAIPAPWALDGVPADFNGKLLAPDWPRFAEIMDGAVRRVPAIGDAGINRMINGPEAFTPDNEFILGESEVRRVLRGCRVLRPRDRRGGRDRPPDGDLDRRRRAGARPLEDGHPPLRRGSTVRRPTPWPGRPRSTRPTTTSTTRTRSARPAGRSGRRRPTSCWPALGRSVRREVGLGAAQLVRVERARRRRVAPAARLGRDALVAGDRRRGAGHAACGRPVRRVVLRQARGRSVPARCGFLQRLCANDVDGPVGRIVYTSAARPARRDPVRPDGHPADGAIGSCSSPGRRSAATTSAGFAGTFRATAACSSTT